MGGGEACPLLSKNPIDERGSEIVSRFRHNAVTHRKYKRVPKLGNPLPVVQNKQEVRAKSSKAP